MDYHLYQIGEEVTFEGRFEGVRAAGGYTVKAQLPPLGDELQYRIRSATEPHERVVLEHQLKRQVPDNSKSFFRQHGSAAT